MVRLRFGYVLPLMWWNVPDRARKLCMNGGIDWLALDLGARRVLAKVVYWLLSRDG